MDNQEKLDGLIREYAKHISSAHHTAYFTYAVEHKSKLFRYTHSSLPRYGVYESLIYARLHNVDISIADLCKQIGISRQAITAIVKDYLAEGWAECEKKGRRKYYRASDVLLNSFLIKMSMYLERTTTDEIMDLKHSIKTLLGRSR